ncbi:MULTISPECIES: SDR family oxidoreductase [Brevibacillus]|jgi:Dehydrogenases with different specificities (related to short-chain alcohol dehydrogenases)|uniref:Alcohol dehydrogenase n=1 Tax=Brevibacillus parabrevis TaxID=54914 RepID=A0A4Y3PCD4_BREPA|nr:MULTISPECIES: SDR family oxidoreductase [Brevibacillus]MDH6351127.1 3-oxoacyl-[acyl-carrier protein] reductase [Brevibacillus sp. 1238]MDR4997628.1 SDR family oxidoreductase [Brevibacillus parabrevis]MED2255928.1 SDR family oxidoreductase [Brevibacillus parabrevis]NRQ53224.1 SDR family oxidoreductase [Brevibacillus sp. HD1.4A]RNB97118.1 SDR family oxidoreductase [Brevibacillus parabrevis]
MSGQLLQGKTAIVTGAASGMGKATAKLFAAEGANVVLADLNKEAAVQVALELPDGRGHAVQVDVADDESVAALIQETVAVFGAPDVLVNCAGVPQAFTPIEELTLEQWDRIMSVNAKSLYLTARHAVPHMKAKARGSIINIASIAGIRARPGLNAYCASKGAAIMLSKALAIELAPYQIRVNVINPGPAETPMLGKFINGDEQEVEAGKKDIFISSVPLGMLIQPEDIAQAALYLASDLSKIVTGEVMNVDGGRGI